MLQFGGVNDFLMIFKSFIPYIHCTQLVFSFIYLEVLVFGYHGDLVAVHADDTTLEMHQLTLTHLHHVTGRHGV